MNLSVIYLSICVNLLVWRNRVRRLATEPVVMSSSPATDIYIAHAWLVNQPKYFESTFVVVSLLTKISKVEILLK